MRRSIFMSLVVIGAVIAMATGAGTFAAFTDSGTASGTVTAGTLDIKLNGNDFTAGVYSYNLPAPCNNIGPGGTCTHTITISNVGSLPATLSVGAATAAGALSLCDGGGHLSGTASLAGGSPQTLAPAASVVLTVTGTLALAAGNPCQGLTGTIDVAITATNP